MQIDVISDTVCPWCFISKRRLTRAMDMQPEIAFDVRWRPFQLDSSVPKGGIAREAYLSAKFGAEGRLTDMHKLIAAEGEKEGIAFDFAAIARQPNTVDSHRLVRWAAATGVQDEVVERLFIAFFENGEDIGDIRVLADIADMSGMDGLEVARLLDTDTDAALVEREDRIAREMGVTGVPAFIFGGKLAVSGAREAPLLATVIDRAAQMQAGAPEASPDTEADEEN